MPTAVVTERTRELEAVNEEQVRVIEEQKAAIYRLKVEAGDHTGALCWCPALVPCVRALRWCGLCWWRHSCLLQCCQCCSLAILLACLLALAPILLACWLALARSRSPKMNL